MFFAPAFCAQPRCGERTRLACWRLRKLSRVANFSYVFDQASHEAPTKFISARHRNQHARRMRYLITGSERLALAADSGAASASYGVSEWALVER